MLDYLKICLEELDNTVFWYIIILCLILIAGFSAKFIKKNDESYEKLVFYFCCLLLLFFAAVRSVKVGADTFQYQYLFTWVRDLRFSQIPDAQGGMWYARAEYQNLYYLYYTKVLSFIFSNPQAITIVNSLLLMLFVTMLIKRSSPNYWLSIFLFFVLGFYQVALNLTPSAIASYACMIAIQYAEKKQPVKYFAIVGFASLFHLSVIAFVPLYFLIKIKLKTTGLFVIIGLITILITFYFSETFSILSSIIPARYHWYFGVSVVGLGERIFVWIALMILFMFSWVVLYIYNRQVIWRYKTEFMIVLLISVFYLLSIQMEIFSRAAFIFSPYIIIIIPKMLMPNPKFFTGESNIYNCDQTIVLSKGRISILDMGRAMIVIAGIILYIVRTNVNNIGRTIPYEFFWNS